MQHHRNFVNCVNVPNRDDGIHRNIGKQRNLGSFVVRNLAVGTAKQNVGADTDLTEFAHGVLSRLCLQFAGAGDIRNECQVNEAGIVAACSQRQLTNGFKERQRFDITDRTADFNQCDIGIAGSMSTAGDEILNFIGDVRNDLNGLT